MNIFSSYTVFCIIVVLVLYLFFLFISFIISPLFIVKFIYILVFKYPSDLYFYVNCYIKFIIYKCSIIIINVITNSHLLYIYVLRIFSLLILENCFNLSSLENHSQRLKYVQKQKTWLVHCCRWNATQSYFKKNSFLKWPVKFSTSNNHWRCKNQGICAHNWIHLCYSQI